jgi:hypothetical protein
MRTTGKDTFIYVFFSVLVVFDFTAKKRTSRRKQTEKHEKGDNDLLDKDRWKGGRYFG